MIFHFLQDVYLYYFLKKYPKRTLVFVNTIDTLRRLLSILNLLKLSPLALHAGIQQRQRLKNLDRLVIVNLPRDDENALNAVKLLNMDLAVNKTKLRFILQSCITYYSEQCYTFKWVFRHFLGSPFPMDDSAID